jgi:NAD(P)H-hydrate epimerase
VALDHLSSWGWQTQAYLVRPREPYDPLVVRFVEGGGKLFDTEVDDNLGLLTALTRDCAILLDGVLGTGIKLPLRGRVAEVLDKVGNITQAMEEPPVVIAVDCPSGVDCDSGESAPECISADLTVTMAAVKMGLLKFPAYNYVGELQLVGIGLPDDLSSWRSIRRFVVDEDYVQQNLPERRLDAHKGTFGTALIIAGSVNYTGAAILAGESAYRIGAGLVTLGVPEPLHKILAGQLLEATWLPLPHESGAISENAYDLVSQNLERPTAILIGPGFGLADTTRRFLAHFLVGGQENGSNNDHGDVEKTDRYPALSRLVVDADALKLLASLPDWSRRLPSRAVLTPHPGEMSVLTGLPVAEIQADRLGVAEHYAQFWGHVVVLKGAFSVVASPDGDTAVVPVASPALARAGTGDVLAGLIVGLRAQGVEAFPAAVAAAWIHARAGQHAAAVLGSSAAVLAGDVLQGVVDILATVSNP